MDGSLREQLIRLVTAVLPQPVIQIVHPFVQGHLMKAIISAKIVTMSFVNYKFHFLLFRLGRKSTII